jgi:hypothetical protein
VRARSLGGVTAPPAGLCLIAVRYPDSFDLPNVRYEPTL